jgi:hypothetical protein
MQRIVLRLDLNRARLTGAWDYFEIEYFSSA